MYGRYMRIPILYTKIGGRRPGWIKSEQIKAETPVEALLPHTMASGLRSMKPSTVLSCPYYHEKRRFMVMEMQKNTIDKNAIRLPIT